MNNFVVLSGSAHPKLTQQICDKLGIQAGKVTLSKFSNQETNVEIHQSIRENDVYIVQSGCGQVNDNLIELIIMIGACRTSSARRVICVCPFFPYSRNREPEPEDLKFNASKEEEEEESKKFKKTKANTTIMNLGELPAPSLKTQTKYKHWTAKSGTLIANMITAAGADQIITLDLHDPQFHGFFDIPVDNLTCLPLIAKYIRDNIPDYKDAIIVSPDADGAKRATALSDALNTTIGLIHKDRKNKENMQLVGDVKDKTCILLDDIIDTATTATRAAKLLHDHGAKTIYAVAPHAILSGNAINLLNNSFVDELIVGNTIPQEEHVEKCPKIKVIDFSSMFAEVIRRIHNGESVSFLYGDSHNWEY